MKIYYKVLLQMEWLYPQNTPWNILHMWPEMEGGSLYVTLIPAKMYPHHVNTKSNSNP